MTRYIGQRDKFSCGPTVIVNALKWAGYKGNGENLRRFWINYTNCKEEEGTDNINLDNALQLASCTWFTIIKRIHHPSLHDLCKHLDKKEAVILRYQWEEIGHYAFIPQRESRRDKYLIVNGFQKEETALWIKGKDLEKYLKGRYFWMGVTCGSAAWIIRKVESDGY